MGAKSKLLIIAVLAAAVPGGCSTDYYANCLIRQNTSVGKTRLAMLGSDEHLVKSGRINSHRRIAAQDGTEIDTWIINARGGQCRGTVVITHGIHDSKAGYLSLGERLADRRFDVVLMDLRAHGHSGGEYVTFGAIEKHDEKAVADALLGDGTVHGPIYAFGVSMGAAVAIQYAAIDPNCIAVMAVAPYADGPSVTRRFVPLMSDEKFQAVWKRAGEIAGFDPQETSTVDAAKNLHKPLLVVHGQIDNVVPYSHGQAIVEAAGDDATLITVEWAGHSTILAARETWFADELEKIADGKLRQAGGPPTPALSDAAR